MAPNKKKKKITSNPARGFATISTASKAKTQDVEIGAKAAKQSEARGRGEQLEVSSPSNAQKVSEKALVELSPKELEEQLEVTELQTLIDTYGESMKKSASRQVSRLYTERRLIRTQADHLSMQPWLPSELVQLILDRVAVQEESNDDPRNEPSSYENPSDASDDELLVKIWTLYQILPQLGFSDSEREAALHELMRKKQSHTLRAETGVKDSVWGLGSCLEWLARSTEPAESPIYSTSNGAHLLNQRLEAHVRDTGTPISTSDDSRPVTPSSQPATESQPAVSNAGTTSTSPQLASDPESSVEGDMEPEEMIRKYLSLQSRRFQISPQDTERQDKKSKKYNHSASVSKHAAAKMARLDVKLNSIKSDLLFDQDEADRQWDSIRIDLAREAAERRRLGIADQEVMSIKEETSKPNHVDAAASDIADEATMLGELFSSLPDTASGDASSMTVTDTAGSIIKVRNFGKWNGMSPRRILEEACRARDSSSKVTFKSLSETTFSKRHYVHVQWSCTQELASPIPTEGAVCEARSRWTSVRMDTVACPDVLQSESYASTLALFLIFASSPKEEKAQLRLPPVWRDLWEELKVLRKQQHDKRDMETLRELRAIIAAQISRYRINDGSQPKDAKGSTAMKVVTSLPGPAQKDKFMSAAEAGVLKSSWTSRSTTNLYGTMLEFRKGLPIWNYKKTLLQAFNENQVVIVCGETGCGKSTQVPAYILEEELSNGRPIKIYCTEPRRLSAISLARRVSEELGERKGDVGTFRSLVGFAVRLDSQVTSQTRLIYATTGIVMRMLESTNGLEEVTHLVLDEVHERSLESDFLLIVLRKLIKKRSALKIILMSATVDADRFSRYLDGAPVLTIPGRTFPVETRFLEDAVEATKFRDSGGSGGRMIDEDEEVDDATADAQTTSDSSINAYSDETRETLSNFDEYRINYDLTVKLLETIATATVYSDYSKAILVFMPGIAEIRRLNDMLIGNRVFAKGWNVFPLHSTIAMEEQERAFLIPAPGIRKIVIATNIAETGITIPDVTCVIDTGKHKEMRFDERRQLSRLLESFISRANAKQRRGRAGRVQKGLCFHLFTKHRHDALMAEQQTPEMLRLSLQDLVLRIKICKLGGIEEALSEALDPPSAKNVRRAVDALVDVKALTVSEDLTPLGRQLAMLPLDVFLGKLILLGTFFGCLDATLAVAAILSSKSPFSAPIGARAQADLAKLAFKKGDSDLLTVYNAYCAWRRICNANHGMSEQQFCRKNFLNAQTLSNIEELKGQLLLSLVDAGFVTLNQAEQQALNRLRSYSRQRNFVLIPPQYDNNTANDLILNSVIACSFYPKLLKRDGKGWRNVANNQSVSLHPSSVNKGVDRPPRWLSFYHIMQSSNKFYNAHETSAVEDFAVALLCGEAEFKMYSGVIVIDGNRFRFAVDEWRKMLAMKTLRTQVRGIMVHRFKHPRQELSEWQRGWLDIWQKVFTVEKEK